MKQGKRLPIKFLVSASLMIIIFLYWSSTATIVTTSDVKYINKILAASDVCQPSVQADKMTYFKQIEYIKLVQNAVLNIAPINKGIAFYQTREPKDLYEKKTGLCYDRSRSMQKILALQGFKARHLALYSTQKTHSKLISLISPSIPSHAITEIKTKHGWLVVDSNARWISLDKKNKPIPISEVQKKYNNIQWKIPYPKNTSIQLQGFSIYSRGFTYLYGMYSRTGKFYPPFPAPFPNVCWKEFIYNFTATDNL